MFLLAVIVVLELGEEKKCSPIQTIRQVDYISLSLVRSLALFFFCSHLTCLLCLSIVSPSVRPANQAAVAGQLSHVALRCVAFQQRTRSLAALPG